MRGVRESMMQSSLKECAGTGAGARTFSILLKTKKRILRDQFICCSSGRVPEEYKCERIEGLYTSYDATSANGMKTRFGTMQVCE